MTPKWGFGVAMLPVGALCFYQAHFGRTVLPKWSFWAHRFSLYFTVFQSLRGHASARCVSHKTCFCQAHCFTQGLLRFLPAPPNPTCARSHIWGFPKITHLTHVTCSDVFGLFLWRLHISECPKYMKILGKEEWRRTTGEPEPCPPRNKS